MPNVATKTLITPTSRTPWATIYQDIRSSIGQYSNAAISDQIILEAVDRAVQAVWPKQWVQEQWVTQLTASTVQTVTLPFGVEQVLSCSWAPVDQSQAGSDLPGPLWEIDGITWHWLDTTSNWPSIDWYLSLNVLHRCQPSTVDTAGCTVPLQYLRQLAVAELMPTLATQAGQPLADAVMNAQRLRVQTLQLLPALRTQTRQPHVHQQNVNTVPFLLWGNTVMTWADFL